MTQHINLLSKSRTKKNSTWIALRGLLLLLLFFFNLEHVQRAQLAQSEKF